jgi:hypothetical protein
MGGVWCIVSGDNPNTTQTLEYTKDKYNAKIRKQGVSPKVSPTTYKGRREDAEESKGIITVKRKADDL